MTIDEAFCSQTGNAGEEWGREPISKCPADVQQNNLVSLKYVWSGAGWICPLLVQMTPNSGTEKQPNQPLLISSCLADDWACLAVSYLLPDCRLQMALPGSVSCMQLPTNFAPGWLF